MFEQLNLPYLPLLIKNTCFNEFKTTIKNFKEYQTI